MKLTDKLAVARTHRDEGTRLFKAASFAAAGKEFEQVRTSDRDVHTRTTFDCWSLRPFHLLMAVGIHFCTRR